jgi:hypothetical protein
MGSRTTKSERMRAVQISALIDELIRNQDSETEQLSADLETEGLLSTARQLARLPVLLGPVDPSLEQRIMRQVRNADGPPRPIPRSRLGWAVAALASALLIVMLFTPAGQTAVASFMAVFNLGRTEVHITPVYTANVPGATAVAQSTALQQAMTLEEAQTKVGFTIPQPGYLPTGYRLREVISHTYPDLPAWLPQPFFVELVYEDSQAHELSLRVYPIMLGNKASIAGMNLQATPIQDVLDVDVNGQPGVLLRLGTDRSGPGWQEVVWEQGDLILALSASELTEADLLRIARSID